MLRPYQRKAIDDLYKWFENNTYGNPVLNLPTGAGKSHIVAALCKEAVQNYPGTRILMLTHTRELIAQNAEKMRLHWPNAPLGIYSAGLKRSDIDQITFAGIQSVRKKAEKLGSQSLIIIDECHLTNNDQVGGYRSLIAALEEINPKVRVIGLSASPYRLGQGKLTDGDSPLFHSIIEPVTVSELISDGYLAHLKSKHTYAHIDTSMIRMRGGEYIPREAEEATSAILEAAIGETILRAEGRKHWLIFCSGVETSEQAAQILNAQGIPADSLSSKNSKAERDEIIRKFKAGEIRALTNMNILTVGFDFTDIDLIVMLRPTASPSLYLQMAGRGLRLKSHTDHCLVLDFVGNVEKHGPITNVNPPRPRRQMEGETPIKVCPDCFEQLLISTRECPECGHEFKAEPKPMRLSNADIMGIEPMDMAVTDWKWSAHTSRTSGKEMIKVKYYGGLSDPVITEYFPITHGGTVERRAYEQIQVIAKHAELIGAPTGRTMKGLADWFNTGRHPRILRYMKNGKFYEVRQRLWQ